MLKEIAGMFVQDTTTAFLNADFLVMASTCPPISDTLTNPALD